MPKLVTGLAWFRQATYGMFVHFGLHCQLGHHICAMMDEEIPPDEYWALMDEFRPATDCARQWASLARQAGMRYMVLTAKHHDGFCHWDTATTTHKAPASACGRDLVAEYVEACRAEGLRVGLYYSLLDWTMPGAGDIEHLRADKDAARGVRELAFAQLEELSSNYGRIDVFWYDAPAVDDADLWHAEEMNAMVRSHQPDALFNNRNGLPGDFATPEQRISASDRAWESCMTVNDSWNFQKGDVNWKPTRQLLRNLVSVARGGGNYLLNIGPRGDGSVPEPCVASLIEIGRWLERHGKAIYGTDPTSFARPKHSLYTRKGDTLYVHVFSWHGTGELVIGGLETRALGARLLTTGDELAVDQRGSRLKVTGLPVAPPEPLAPVVAIRFDGEPRQDVRMKRF